jgi:hypothetical protein
LIFLRISSANNISVNQRENFLFLSDIRLPNARLRISGNFLRAVKKNGAEETIQYKIDKAKSQNKPDGTGMYRLK